MTGGSNKWLFVWPEGSVKYELMLDFTAASEMVSTTCQIDGVEWTLKGALREEPGGKHIF